MGDNNRTEVKVARLIKSHKPIILNNRVIKGILGFEDMREFTDALYSWGYTTDFTYRERLTTDWQKHLRAFLKETYLD